MTSFWLFSVVLCLTGLGLGDSPLVILSLSSLALSYVFSIFSFLFLFPLSFPFVFFSLPCVFLHKVVFFNIYLFIYQKKRVVIKLIILWIHFLILVGLLFYQIF